MKSTELYALLKADLGAWFKSADFKRAKGFLSWSRWRGGAGSGSRIEQFCP